MIYLSAILVVLAFGLLVAGVVTGTAVLVMWSIVVSVLSAVFLMVGALLRRHELFPSGGVRAATSPSMPPVGAGAAAGMMAGPGAVSAPGAPSRGPVSPVARSMAVSRMGHPTATLAPSRTLSATGAMSGPAVAGEGGGPSPEAIVLVVPGRKRFHLPGCDRLAARQTEELTCEEAHEEGFSPCTSCLPGGATPTGGPSTEAGNRPGPGPAARPATGRPPAAAHEAADEPDADPGRPSIVERGSAAGAEPARPADESSSEHGQEPTGRASGRPHRASETGYRSEETRPVLPVPAPPARPGTDESPASESGQTSVWRPQAWFSAGPQAASPPAESPGATPPEATGSATTGSGAEGPDTAPAAAEPPIPVEPPVLPEASTPFEAFKRPDPTPQDGTQVPSAATPGHAPQEPAEPARPATAASGETTSPAAPGTAEGAHPDRGASGKAPGQAPGESGEGPEKGESTREVMRPGVVKVIPGTRRYHSSACPLINGAGPDGLESMSRSDAEAQGLTHCSVCDDG